MGREKRKSSSRRGVGVIAVVALVLTFMLIVAALTAVYQTQIKYAEATKERNRIQEAKAREQLYIWGYGSEYWQQGKLIAKNPGPNPVTAVAVYARNPNDGSLRIAWLSNPVVVPADPRADPTTPDGGTAINHNLNNLQEGSIQGVLTSLGNTFWDEPPNPGPDEGAGAGGGPLSELLLVEGVVEDEQDTFMDLTVAVRNVAGENPSTIVSVVATDPNTGNIVEFPLSSPVEVAPGEVKTVSTRINYQVTENLIYHDGGVIWSWTDARILHAGVCSVKETIDYSRGWPPPTYYFYLSAKSLEYNTCFDYLYDEDGEKPAAIIVSKDVSVSAGTDQLKIEWIRNGAQYSRTIDIHYDSPGTYRIAFTVPVSNPSAYSCRSGYAYLDEIKVKEVHIGKPFPQNRVWGVKTANGNLFWQSGTVSSGGGMGQTVLNLSSYDLWVPHGVDNHVIRFQRLGNGIKFYAPHAGAYICNTGTLSATVKVYVNASSGTLTFNWYASKYMEINTPPWQNDICTTDNYHPTFSYTITGPSGTISANLNPAWSGQYCGKSASGTQTISIDSVIQQPGTITITFTVRVPSTGNTCEFGAVSLSLTNITLSVNGVAKPIKPIQIPLGSPTLRVDGDFDVPTPYWVYNRGIALVGSGDKPQNDVGFALASRFYRTGPTYRYFGPAWHFKVDGWKNIPGSLYFVCDVDTMASMYLWNWGAVYQMLELWYSVKDETAGTYLVSSYIQGRHGVSQYYYGTTPELDPLHTIGISLPSSILGSNHKYAVSFCTHDCSGLWGGESLHIWPHLYFTNVRLLFVPDIPLE